MPYIARYVLLQRPELVGNEENKYKERFQNLMQHNVVLSSRNFGWIKDLALDLFAFTGRSKFCSTVEEWMP